MASSSLESIEFRGACDRPMGCGRYLRAALPVEEAEGKTGGIRYRCPYCGATNRLERKTTVDDPA